ncbi:hypothetical protein JCM9743_03750 [Natrinema sp. JCM 9743]
MIGRADSKLIGSRGPVPSIIRRVDSDLERSGFGAVADRLFGYPVRNPPGETRVSGWPSSLVWTPENEGECSIVRCTFAPVFVCAARMASVLLMYE